MLCAMLAQDLSIFFPRWIEGEEQKKYCTECSTNGTPSTRQKEQTVCSCDGQLLYVSKNNYWP